MSVRWEILLIQTFLRKMLKNIVKLMTSNFRLFEVNSHVR